jgi:hypothetical protein
MKFSIRLLAGLTIGLSLSLGAQEIVTIEQGSSPPDVSLSFRKIKNGDVVPTSFRVYFVIQGMKVEPAGTYKENTGHHHLLLDVDKLPPMDLPLPKNESIYHFGGGETSALLTLPPGEHTLIISEALV